MKNEELLNQILPILHAVKDDGEKLQQILDFLLEEIYEEPDDTVVIPEKYRKLVHDIAESIDSGMVCFVNPETLEMEDVPKSILEERFFTEADEDEECEDDVLTLQHEKWAKCLTVDPPESSESFRIMETFVSKVDDKKLQKQLVNALENRRPFANFKYQIEGSTYRKEWFAYKQQKLEEYVWGELSFDTNSESFENRQNLN